MLNNVKRKVQEGFTLVEILIVVVIVGILAAIAIPTYFNYVEKAYASDAQTQIKTLLEECKIWKTTHEDIPADVQEMIDEGFGNWKHEYHILKLKAEISVIVSAIVEF